MCRYAQMKHMFLPYKTHWACVACRHTCKLWPERDLGIAPRCPRCGQPMVELGRDFHAPKRDNLRQWRKVKMLVDAGITFDSCGCSGPGYRPRTLADAKSELGHRRSAKKRHVEVKIPKRWRWRY